MDLEQAVQLGHNIKKNGSRVRLRFLHSTKESFKRARSFVKVTSLLVLPQLTWNLDGGNTKKVPGTIHSICQTKNQKKVCRGKSSQPNTTRLKNRSKSLHNGYTMLFVTAKTLSSFHLSLSYLMSLSCPAVSILSTALTSVPRTVTQFPSFLPTLSRPSLPLVPHVRAEGGLAHFGLWWNG